MKFRSVYVIRAGVVLYMSMLAAAAFAESGTVALKPGLTTIHLPAAFGEAPEAKSDLIAMDVFIPPTKTIAGDILVLPGWRFSRTRWHKETDLLKFCGEHGFRALFPEMGITNYESRYFPETTMRWGPVPGGEWVRKVLIPQAQEKYGLLRYGKRNFLLGLSTGGRGVLLVSLQNPGLFTAGATLSGDCNQLKMPGDRLMAGSYGPFGRFMERWASVDNPGVEAERGNWTMPLYIGHGRADKVSPFSQSLSLYTTLTKKYPRLRVEFNGPENAGHDFTYWNSELKAVFDFFIGIK